MSDQSIQMLNPGSIHKPVGYSHVAKVNAGKPVFIAGQVALDGNADLVGRHDFRAQARQVFENLNHALGAAGGAFSNVVKLNVYVVDASHLPQYREVRDLFVNVHNPPASTVVQVAALFRPEFLLEVEAVAVVPE